MPADFASEDVGGTRSSMGEAGGAEEVRVAIVGAGVGGLAAAAHLRRAGYDDVVLLERGDAIGGTWRDNTYPGCACDVPSALYSFSFAPNPEWSRFYSSQDEIRRYVDYVAERERVADRVRLNAEVLDATWDEDARRWRIATSAGDLAARVLVSATGPWSEPVYPDVPGLDAFAGRAFHSSRWDHGHDLTGRHVAVIGTGASAVQFLPRIRKRAAKITLYQRTAQWVLPKPDRRIGRAERALYRRVPGAQRALRAGVFAMSEGVGVCTRRPKAMRQLQRIAELHLRLGVRDPELRRVLTPDHVLGCKRPLFSNDWYSALTSPNVEVVPHAVTEIRPHGIVAADGVERAADTLVLGTGFTITDLPIARRVRGRHGLTLDETWRGSPRGHLGTTVAGFPNLFVLLGPNVGNAHSSAILLHEMQSRYLVSALRAMDWNALDSVDPLDAAQDAFNADVQRRLVGSIWNAGGCSSYYLDATGTNSTIYPGSTIELRRRLRAIDLDEYRTTSPRPAPVLART